MSRAIASVAANGGHRVQQVGRGDLDTAVPGEVVADITNPLDLTTSDSVVLPAYSFATAEIAAALPASRVLIAGDDADAKSVLTPPQTPREEARP